MTGEMVKRGQRYYEIRIKRRGRGGMSEEEGLSGSEYSGEEREW